ncbi:MAG: Arm DNA-binding domain-containing protein [Actinobacteria bacterium]|nr:Arm DNA-binding domain-containing protein [Actinomycetota bacterium]
MPRQKLTARLVLSASCPPDRARITISDTNTHGLVLEVRASGGRTFYARYWDDRGAQRNLKIGNARSISLDAARRKTIVSATWAPPSSDP